MTLTDWLLICMIAAFFFLLCVLRSRTRLLWSDELLGFHLISSPSTSQMLKGWSEGADGGGVVYYLLARVFTRIFGMSALTLRLFSTAGMMTSLVFVWCMARRYASTIVVACTVGLVYFVPAAMRWQEVNGRFYGFFLASAALAALWFLVTAEREPTSFDLVVTFLAHACLIGSHILGMIYSFSLIAGMLTLGAMRGQLRWRVYLSAAATWALVPVSYHAIRSSAAIGAGVFWTTKPRAFDLLNAFTDYDWDALLVVYLLLLATTALVLFRGRKSHWVSPVRESGLPPIVLVASLVLAQLIIFAKSQFGTSIYADRYLLPLMIATTLIVAALLTFLLPRFFTDNSSQLRSLSVSVIVLFLFFYFPIARRFDYGDQYPNRGLPQRITAAIPEGSPVVITQVAIFELLTTYDKQHNYLYFLDSAYDSDPSHPHGDLYGARMMESWQRAGYEEGHILECPVILSQYPHFVLILDSFREHWFEDRLLHNPAYQVTPMGSNKEWVPVTLWKIDRRYPAPPPC